jgi:hypothetical protein
MELVTFIRRRVDQPITFKTSKAFNALHAQEKLTRDEEVHDSRPPPSMILNERLPDILDKVFDGYDTNQLYDEIANGQMNTAKSTQKKIAQP